MNSVPAALRRLLDVVSARFAGRDLVGYAGALAARGMEAGGKFGLYAAAARTLGGHDAGLFFLCLNWVNFLSTAARMGLEKAATRHVAAEIAVGRGRAARHAAVAATAAMTGAAAVAALLTFAVAGPVARGLFRQPELARPLAWSALILLPQTLDWAVSFVLLGLKRGVAAQWVLNALPPVLSLAALLAGARSLDLLFAAYAGSFALCCGIGLGFVARDWRTKLVDRPTGPMAGAAEPLPSLWASARPFYAVEMIQNAVLSLPTFVLGAFAPPASVSEFSIATRLSNLVNTVILSVGAMAAPAFAEHHRRGEYAALRRVMRQTWLMSVALSLPAIAAMLLLPDLLMRLLGSDFGAAWQVLSLLALGQLVNCMLPCQDTLLAMTGHGPVLRRLNLGQLGLCVVLAAVLIPTFGMVGAAATAAAALALYMIGCALAVRRVLPPAAAALPA